MYLFLKLIVLLFISSPVFAYTYPYTFDGNNTITGLSSGNVGLGSTNPNQKLDVNGAIRSANFSGQSSGTLICIKTGGALGYCSGVVTGIACTCN